MSDNGNPLGTDLQSAQEAISALMAPLEEDNATEADAQGNALGEAEEYEATAEDYDASEPDDEDYSDDDGEEELGEETLYTVKIRGEEQQVTLDELVNGYQRQKDYTHKSMELAEQRKAIQSLEEQIDAERAQYAQLLPQLQAQLQQQLQAEPDWDTLYEQNPIEATKLERQWRKAAEMRQQQLQAVEAEQQRLKRVNDEKLQRAMAQHREAEGKRLLEVVPEWRDQNVYKKEAAEIRDFLIGNGFSEQDVDNISSAAVIRMARNAMLYERGNSKVQQAKMQTSKGPKVMKAGTSGNQARKRGAAEKAQQRLKQSGRVADAADLIQSLL